jgi:hypothetical protein
MNIHSIALEDVHRGRRLRLVVELDEAEVIKLIGVKFGVFGDDTKGLKSRKWTENVRNFTFSGVRG